MTRAALVIDGGLTRSDAFLTYWTVPWQILAGIFEGVANALRGFPLVSFAWRARFVTIGIAVIQTAHSGPLWLAAFIATIGILSYAAPAWIRRWDAAMSAYGNHALAAAEMPVETTLLDPHVGAPEDARDDPGKLLTAAQTKRARPSVGHHRSETSSFNCVN